MEELPEELKAFLLEHPLFHLTEDRKIKCTVNGHEFPCNLAELQNYTRGKKYQQMRASSEFCYSQYQPHIVASSKQPNQLFCKLTLRHINRQPAHVLKHVNGKRFKNALNKYDECVRQGIKYVPARLQQKSRKCDEGEVKRGRSSQRRNPYSESSSSEVDHDSEDSMSDLYPSTVFTPKRVGEGEEGNGKDDEGDFQMDDKEEEDIEVARRMQHKRKKVQPDGSQMFKNKFWKRRCNKKSRQMHSGI
ncbi:surfeit locus protein 2 isoform X1 [Lampris incognitus]|uniref:surfeit locus protein 2 isoform X1 n=1 Tax=Lampris incognitus TaxID=2546036 RepID=UPI0024B499D6|nr:surfeit locus protein 2 isoform X1 [Lampris incognitus]